MTMADVQTQPGLDSFDSEQQLYRRARKRQKISRTQSLLRMEVQYPDASSPKDIPGTKHKLPYIPELELPSPRIPYITETAASPHTLHPAHTSPLNGAKQSQHSTVARTAMETIKASRNPSNCTKNLAPPEVKKQTPVGSQMCTPYGTTPAATAPNSPRIRPLTLDIPGLTKSKVSPDGRIASRDIGAKLVIIMVGLPARGKSYITKKVARYLNWLQHDAKIFNVGHRRRQAAGMDVDKLASTPTEVAPVPQPNAENESHPHMDQSSSFFDPNNAEAASLRQKVAMETLDELLHYICFENGSVGILDATNSTIERREAIVRRIREVAGNELGILFIESCCTDERLLEANIRLKLDGPDYKGMDPQKALEDFRRRIANYTNTYVPIGDYEEQKGYSYIKMVDVGRKMIMHGKMGFVANQTASYLMNFNLSQRQIWITRHGQSVDNVDNRIGGDAELTEQGVQYAKDLANFIMFERQKFRERQLKQFEEASRDGPLPGDITPPNPEYSDPSTEGKDGEPAEKNFCVWTSMLKRSIQTAQFFDEEQFDIKEMRMLDELNAGKMDGLTYSEIAERFPLDFEMRRQDKLHYRYPGSGGESYLDVINRLRPVIHEVERMTEHVLLIGHTVVARVLLAYFLNLSREDVAHLEAPLGYLYALEPKPYGTEFKAYKHNPETHWFELDVNHKIRPGILKQ